MLSTPTRMTMTTSGTMLLSSNGSWTNMSTSRPSSYCEDDSCYASFARFVHMMDLIVVPIIIVVGVVGNVVSCLVFTCTYLRRVSSSVYLAALAVVDTAYLCVLFFSWLVHVDIQVACSCLTRLAIAIDHLGITVPTF